jgi:hypothetical protein
MTEKPSRHARLAFLCKQSFLCVLRGRPRLRSQSGQRCDRSLVVSPSPREQRGMLENVAAFRGYGSNRVAQCKCSGPLVQRPDQRSAPLQQSGQVSKGKMLWGEQTRPRGFWEPAATAGPDLTAAMVPMSHKVWLGRETRSRAAVGTFRYDRWGFRARQEAAIDLLASTG